jgi:pre-rRNA-processing protein TSR4
MWAGGDDWSETGEQVRLFQPTLYARNKAVDPATTSYVGGGHNGDANSPHCRICEKQMYLLVHLVVPRRKKEAREQHQQQRYLQVFACNNASCLNRVLSENSLCYGGAGVVVCVRTSVNGPATTSASNQNKALKKEPDDDWTVTTDETAVDDLEAKLAAMETALSSKKVSTKPTAKPSTAKAQPTKDGSAYQFPSFPLTSLLEPPAARLTNGAIDDDDVGLSTASISDDKIQAMLAKYISEEEDEGILSMLRGTTTSAGDGGGGKERDERLSASERALLTYSDRLKRSPRQVLRYAYGGVPMWSM